MRAGRLIAMIGLLRAKGRLTAARLADELEVSERTIWRDVEALSGAGVPVFVVRGRFGGVELLDAAARPGGSPLTALGWPVPPGREMRVRVRITDHGLRLATVLGRPTGVRVRRSVTVVTHDGGDWWEASARTASVNSGVCEVLALGSDVEVLSPPALRRAVHEAARSTVALYEHDAP